MQGVVGVVVVVVVVAGSQRRFKAQGSRRPLLAEHTLGLAAHLALSTLQGARACRVGGRWICGIVSDADAGDTTRGRARWVWAYCCNPLCGSARSWRQSVRLRGTHAGTGGSFGGRAKAQSDGVASGQWAGLEQAVGDQWN